jgi:YesN/AraC family two-component response regulator
LLKETIDLVVSDVMMPVMDGFELCKAIKSNFEYSHVPVILLTAKNTLKSKITGLELGADAYIEKPFDAEHLQVQIANLLANRFKLKEYFAKSPLVHLKTVAHTRSDETFLEKLNEAIQNNLDDQDLDVDKLARCMNMSRTSLFRKIKSITDLTPNDLINITRLKKAAEYLAEGDYKIYEVSDMVGYGSQTNFGRNFFKQFGMTPTEYQKLKQEGK